MEQIENEVWKPVVGYEGLYEISSIGRLKSLERAYPLNGRWSQRTVRHMPEKLYKPYLSHTGYYCVFIHYHGRHRKIIHRLVAEAFVPNPANKPYVNHKDSNRQNNTVENLEWVTFQENMAHGYHYGKVTIPLTIGSNNGRAILNELQVIEIRKMYKEGVKPKKIRELYNITKSCLEGILSRKNWKHI